MVDISVSFNGLSTASGDIASAATGLETVLNNMDSSLQPLKANWTGGASEAYTVAKGKWTSAITDMKALLADVGRLVASSGEQYKGADNQNAQRFGG